MFSVLHEKFISQVEWYMCGLGLHVKHIGGWEFKGRLAKPIQIRSTPQIVKKNVLNFWQIHLKHNFDFLVIYKKTWIES